MKKFFDKIRTGISLTLLAIALLTGVICLIPIGLVIMLAGLISPSESKTISKERVEALTKKIEDATKNFDKTGKFEIKIEG
ncbi:hypothetical protein [Kosakonia phage Kc304]|nr:hypothetical protein [Kosakonia phage Kc304]UJJ22053.1 hypothetical protein [Erwinia phage Virsaitis27]